MIRPPKGAVLVALCTFPAPRVSASPAPTHTIHLTTNLPRPQSVIVLTFTSEHLHLLATQRSHKGHAPLLVSLATNEPPDADASISGGNLLSPGSVKCRRVLPTSHTPSGVAPGPCFRNVSKILYPVNQGSPTFRLLCLMIWSGADIIIIEIKCIINVMHLDHSKTISLPLSPWKNIPQNQSLLSKRLGTSGLNQWCFCHHRLHAFSDLEAGQVQGLQACGVQPNNHFTI